jgi:superfamily II RNA helicase
VILGRMHCGLPFHHAMIHGHVLMITPEPVSWVLGVSVQVLAALQAENMLPAIWFIMNRKDCDVSAITADVVLTSSEEQEVIQQELQQLR